MSAWVEVAKLLSAGRHEDAERALLVARQRVPNPVGEAIVSARIAWEQGRPGQAVAILTAAVERSPSAAPLHTALAEMWLLLDRQEEADAAANVARRLKTPRPASAMGALLGDSLFSGVSARTGLIRSGAVRKRRVGLVRSALIAMLVLLLGVASTSLFRFATAQRAARDAETVARDLRHLLRIGSFEAAIPVAQRLSEMSLRASSSAHSDLLALHAALLHRYWGLDRPQLSIAGGTIEGEVARAVLAESDGKSWPLSRLETLAARDVQEVHLRALIARARSDAGELEAADRAFDEAAALEPTNFAYAAERLEHLLRSGRVHEARDLADHMRDVSPGSLWVARAEVLLRGLAP